MLQTGDLELFWYYKCNDCGNIATRIYSIFIDEVPPSFCHTGKAKNRGLGGIQIFLNIVVWKEPAYGSEISIFKPSKPRSSVVRALN